jgi:hypothetical protein
MSKQTNKLGSCSKKKIPQQKNPCKKRQCKVSLLPDVPSSVDGGEDRDPNPGVESGPHEPPPHIRWCPQSLQMGAVSKTVCDLINKIKMREELQPELLFGKNQILAPPPVFLDDSIPIKPGPKLIVDIPVNPCRITDIYIDDFILLAVDIEGTDNLQRCDHAPLLAFD